MDILNIISWIKGKQVVTTADPNTTVLPLGIRTPRRQDAYLPVVMTVSDFAAQMPAGPTGAQGPIGPQGVAGPVGPAGLEWQGAWSATGVYAIDDAVGYGGASWFCIDPVGPSATTPDLDPTNWALLASQGSPGPMGPQGIQGPVGPTGMSSLPYSNVLFVDPINGDDLTALSNRFDKPYLSIAAARTAAVALGPTQGNRAFIYIRRGFYIAGIQLTNYVDFYCEPGVVFVTNASVTDAGVSVISNVYGSLKMNSTNGINITGSSSYCTIEFDEIITTYPSISVVCTSVNNRITINGNYILSNGFSGGCGLTIRYASNVTLNITNSINCQHETLQFRYYTGTTTVNCPNINLTAGNIYGGNYKAMLYISDLATTGKITINGNLNCTDTVNYGGLSSGVILWANATPKLVINGDIKGGIIRAISGNTYASAVIEVNGNISSSNLTTIVTDGNGQIVFRNSVIINTGVVAGSYIASINNTAKIFFKDCYFYNGLTDSDLIKIIAVSTNLVIDGCQGYTPGLYGESITATIPVTARIHNSRFNKALSVNVTDLYSPTGMIVDTNTIVPTVII